MLAAGFNPDVGFERLGHTNISVTMDTYSHVMTGIQAEVARLVNEQMAKVELR